MKKHIVIIISSLFYISCSKQPSQFALFYSKNKTIRVDNFKFYNNDQMTLYLYVENNNIRNSIYNSKTDSLTLYVKDSVFRGKPQRVMLDGYFTTDFILPINSITNKIQVDTFMGKPMFYMPFIKTTHMPFIKSGIIESEAIKSN